MYQRIQIPLVCLLLVLLPVMIFAQAGQLDPSFGSGGSVVTSFPGNSGAYATDMAVQPDGRIILVGVAGLKGAIARYLPSGTLDPSFSGDGLANTAITGHYSTAWHSVAIQADGKIVVAGNVFDNPYYDQAIARFTSAGALDPSFGNGGIKLIDHLGSTYERCEAVSVTPSGHILVLSTWNSEDGYDVVYMAQLNDDGSFDTAFGTNGIVVYPGVNANGQSYAPKTLLVEPDGRFLIAGNYVGGFGNKMFIGRYTSTGGHVNSFGGSGIVRVDFGYGETYSRADALGLTPDGEIIVGGVILVGQKAFALAHITAAGTLDQSFGLAGLASAFFGSDFAYVDDMEITTDGKILACGFSGPALDSVHFAMARFNSNGLLDASFGQNGTTLVELNDYDAGSACAMDATGRYLIAGYTNNGVSRFALIGLTSGYNIGMDESDGGQAIQIYPVPAHEEVRIAMQAEDPSDQVSVQNALGMVVNQGPYRDGRLTLRNIPAGLYFVSVFNRQGELRARAKFLKE